MHKEHSGRTRKISDLVFSKGKVRIAKSTFLSWLSVIETVPQKWKQQIRSGEYIMPSDPLQNKVIPIITVKEVYNKLLSKIRKPSTAQKTIEEVIHTTDVNWPKVYMIPQKVTIDATLRIFQFKILNNILYLNKKISKFDLNLSALCSLCSQHPPHLFCNCVKTQDLWNSFASALGENLDLLQLNSTIVFLREPNIQGNDNILLNHILLLFKKKRSPSQNSLSIIHELRKRS